MSQEGGPYLLFDVGHDAEDAGVFALEVKEVAQVIEPGFVSPVPLAPSLVRGIINHHGRIVTVLDPAPIFGLAPQGATVAQIVIMRLPKRTSGNVGLQIRRSFGMVPPSELLEAQVPQRPCVRRIAQWGKRLVHVVALDAFWERLGREFVPYEPRESGQGVSV